VLPDEGEGASDRSGGPQAGGNQPRQRISLYDDDHHERRKKTGAGSDDESRAFSPRGHLWKACLYGTDGLLVAVEYVRNVSEEGERAS
jgi:hypothetical protein